jgi:hypothetical protein
MSSQQNDTPEVVHAELEDHFRSRTESLVWYHRLGQLFVRLKAVTPYGAGWQKEASRRYGLTKEETYQAWRFACRCDERDARRWNGRITPGKIGAALVVRNRDRFVDLIDKAVLRRMTARQITAEVGQEVVSNPPRGGRRPGRPRTRGCARDAAAYLRLLNRVEDVRTAIIAPPVSGLLAAIEAGAAAGNEPRAVKLRDIVTAVATRKAVLGRALAADAQSMQAALEAGQRRSRRSR